MLPRSLLIAFKIVIALLCFAAIVTEVATLAERGVLKVANFLSYFTVESNILVVVVLLVSALATADGRTAGIDGFRGAVTVYILIVGIGFAALLSHMDGLTLTAVPWDNTVLHYIVPVAVAADWLIDRPLRPVGFVQGLWWLLFPVAYAVYAMTRGAISGWYPYPFLDPGYDGLAAVLTTIAGLVLLGVVLVLAVTKVPGRVPRVDA